MKIDFKNHRKFIVGGVVLLAAATPSFAQFGGIVFDPTGYGELITKATTAFNQLKAIEANVTHFSFKQLWQTTETQMANTNVKNLFGETNGMSTALNTNSSTAATMAWNSSTVPLNSDATSYLASQPATSAQRSQLAMIESSDAASPDCLNAVGKYRAARAANAAAETNLEQQQLDSSSATNSEVEQLNLLNASEAQKMTEMQTQGVLHACLAEQMAVSNMQQRNAAAQDLNTWGYVQQQQAANPTFAGNGSDTDSYLP